MIGLLQTAESSNLKVLPSEFGADCSRFKSRSSLSELSLNCRFFLLTIKKKESEQETNHSSSIESPRFLPFSFEELQKRSLLGRNCTEVGWSGLCDPLRFWKRFFEVFLNFREVKPFEAQGEFRGEDLILVYASTLPMDTVPIINFLVLLGFDYVKRQV